jgi:putative oxidoreductase
MSCVTRFDSCNKDADSNSDGVTFKPVDNVSPVYRGYLGDAMVGGGFGPNYEVYGYDGLGDQVGGTQVGGFLGISNTFIARLLISALFIYSGIQAVANFSQYSQSIASTGIPYASLVAVISIILQLLGGLFFTGILAVYNSVSWGKLALLLYLVANTAMSHNAFKNPSEITNMLQNLAIIGGLMLA